MTPEERARFDELLEDVIEGLPRRVRALLDELSVVVEDEPDPRLLEELERDGVIEPGAGADEVCGLHTGTGLTDRSIEWSGYLPDQIHLFRRGIASLALEGQDSTGPSAEEAVYEEIRITLLHEIGHHFGLDEEDLEELGYG